MARIVGNRSGGWTNPSPFVKQTTTTLLFGAAIVITLMAPNLSVRNPAAFFSGIAVLVVATAISAFLSARKPLWKYAVIIGILDFGSLTLLRLGGDAGASSLMLLAVLPAIYIAGESGRRNIVYAALGSFVALVAPVLLAGPGSQMLDLGIGIFGSVVLTIVIIIFHEVTSGQRKNLVDMVDLSQLTDELLQESVRQIELLEKTQVERRAAEQTFRGLWSAVTEQAAIGTDLDGLIDAWNPGAEKMFRVTRAEAEGRLLITSFHRADELLEHEQELELELEQDRTPGDPGFVALVDSARRGVAEVRNWTYIGGDGVEFPVQVSVTPRLGPDGEFIGYLFVANDMTEAREVAKLKDEFVGLISHELRTPLSSILGYLELLRDDDEDDQLSAQQLQYLDVAERNAQRLLRLVSDLLFTAQVDSGSFDLDVHELELAPILVASIESARPMAAAAGVTLASDIASDVSVKGDPLRLGQAVDNLVSNAIKFTPRGGVVSVSLREQGTDAVVAVSDTGLGIAASEIDKLFSRFFRATSATRNAVPGVGLGLTITKAIVTAHHGVMSVESEEGVGTSFRFVLQRVSADTARARSDA